MAVTVWINAFIPKSVSGYTELIKAGTQAGKTAIRLPSIARPLNLGKPSNDGYLTDQRTFSSLLTASSRMHSVADIDLLPTPALAKQAHTTSGTTEVDIVSGAQLDFGKADMSKCRFFNFTVSTNKTVITIDVKGAASDPLVRGASNITYSGTFTITLQPARIGPGRTLVSFKGKIDVFPAFEAYARIGNVTRTLFKSPPPFGNTVVDLALHLGPTLPRSGSATF